MTFFQDFYRQVFELLDDGAWQHAPVGPLAGHWRGTGNAQSTNYLVNVAATIYGLMMNASPGVDRTIRQRLRTVLRPPDPHAAEEALVELEVGGMLAQQVTPVLLEPLVPPEARSLPNPPMSPDYGLRVPEGLVTVEVTVWHWEAYSAWQRMYDEVFRTLSKRMTDRGIERSVRIELPIGTPQGVARLLWSHEFLDALSREPEGAIESVAGRAPRPVRVAWHPVFHFDDMDSVDWQMMASYGNPPFTVGTGIAQSQSISGSACIDEDDRRSALASLRRSVDRKKRQCDPTLPHFLAIGTTFPRIAVSPGEWVPTWDVFGPLIEGRLWPNPRYGWLSGVLQKRTERVAAWGQDFHRLDYNPNPNAAVPAPATIGRALSGQGDFHAMWQRPRRPTV